MAASMTCERIGLGYTPQATVRPELKARALGWDHTELKEVASEAQKISDRLVAGARDRAATRENNSPSPGRNAAEAISSLHPFPAPTKGFQPRAAPPAKRRAQPVTFSSLPLLWFRSLLVFPFLFFLLPVAARAQTISMRCNPTSIRAGESVTVSVSCFRGSRHQHHG